MRDLNAADLESMAFLLAAAIVAGFVRGFTGFGGPALMSLVLTQFFTPLSLIPKIALMELCAYPALLMNVRKDVAWSLMLPLASAVLIAIPIGVWSMLQIDQVSLKRLIAACVGIGVVALMVGWRLNKVPSKLALLPIGLFLGWLLGATFIALPLAAFMLMLPISALACRASMMLFALITGPFFFAVIVYNGLIALSDIVPVVVVGLAYLAMTWLGSIVFRRVGERDYRRTAYWLMLLLALATLLR